MSNHKPLYCAKGHRSLKVGCVACVAELENRFVAQLAERDAIIEQLTETVSFGLKALNKHSRWGQAADHRRQAAEQRIAALEKYIEDIFKCFPAVEKEKLLAALSVEADAKGGTQ